MDEFSKENHNALLDLLIKLKDQSESKGFIEEMKIFDNYRTGNTEGVKLFYEHLMSKVKMQ